MAIEVGTSREKTMKWGEKLVSTKVEMARVAQDAKNQAAERELKLRIARENNMTTLATSQMSAQQKTNSDEIKNQDKKKPIRMEVQRDPSTREITGIVPIYEEIKKEAEVIPSDLQVMAEALLPDDAEGGDGNG